ncbi:MAG: hypothetical protein R6W68_03830 [Ignavibacteriaceae bacterium]
MKRKNYIVIAFTLIFAIATTGLPLSLHYCEMMKSTSLDECSICITEIETPSCCSLKSNGENLSSTKKSACCETVLIAQPIEDDYLITKTEIQIFQYNAQSYFPELIIENQFLDNSDIHFTSHSPPMPAEHLFILNSIFLI